MTWNGRTLKIITFGEVFHAKYNDSLSMMTSDLCYDLAHRGPGSLTVSTVNFMNS